MTDAAGQARIGCSGYDYPAWRGGFYPDDLPRDRFFDHYARTFRCVEVNNTFYNLPERGTVRQWHDRAPRGFRYALKLSRYATHMKHLKDPDEWLDRFVDRAEQLGANLGPVLVQLPPHWNPDPQRLGAFLDEAPNDIRWAVECRDERWLTEKVFETLSEANAALVIHDLIDDHPRHLTADFVYLRFHGPDRRNPYHGGYTHQSLAAHARRAAEWIDSGHAVYAFFNNDADGFAPRDARRFQRYLDDALDRG